MLKPKPKILSLFIPFNRYVHDQHSNLEGSTHTWVDNMHVPPNMVHCYIRFSRHQSMSKLKILVLASLPTCSLCTGKCKLVNEDI